ncbi:MAG: alpha/beta hydrolase fold domain-containing protein [Actinobacteria bacterium]|nr:alpha/beta hydrolase fold domain-containing protein [Actinomycetota bacterium]
MSSWFRGRIVAFSPQVAVAIGLIILTASCGAIGGNEAAKGWPDVDFGVSAVQYRDTPERPLYVHIFAPDDIVDQRGSVLFFHGGGFARTRVEQFEHQARAIAANGMFAFIVEYRVTSEGTSVDDAIGDGAAALQWVRDNVETFGLDPNRIAMAGGSAGGALAVRAGGEPDAYVLFNPAVDSETEVTEVATIAFHSREDQLVDFASVETFCAQLTLCDLVAFDVGDHGFFNTEPQLTETTELMVEFLLANEW